MLLLQGERTCSTTLIKLTHEQQCYSYRENTTYHYTMNQFMHTGKFDVHCNMCITCESQELDEDSQAENQRGEQSIPRMQAWVEGRGLGTHFFCSQPL